MVNCTKDILRSLIRRTQLTMLSQIVIKILKLYATKFQVSNSLHTLSGKASSFIFITDSWNSKSYFVYFICWAFSVAKFIHMQNYPWYSEENRMSFSKWNTWKEGYFYFKPPVYFNLFCWWSQDLQEQSHILTHTKFVLDYGGQLCFHSRSWFISPWIGLNELLDNSWDQP